MLFGSPFSPNAVLSEKWVLGYGPRILYVTKSQDAWGLQEVHQPPLQVLSLCPKLCTSPLFLIVPGVSSSLLPSTST